LCFEPRVHRVREVSTPTSPPPAQDERSQSRNRELALERLRERLGDALAPERPRHATRPTRASVERRLEDKRRQSARKQTRERPPDEH